MNDSYPFTLVDTWQISLNELYDKGLADDITTLQGNLTNLSDTVTANSNYFEAKINDISLITSNSSIFTSNIYTSYVNNSIFDTVNNINTIQFSCNIVFTSNAYVSNLINPTLYNSTIVGNVGNIETCSNLTLHGSASNIDLYGSAYLSYQPRCTVASTGALSFFFDLASIPTGTVTYPLLWFQFDGLNHIKYQYTDDYGSVVQQQYTLFQ